MGCFQKFSSEKAKTDFFRKLFFFSFAKIIFWKKKRLNESQLGLQLWRTSQGMDRSIHSGQGFKKNILFLSLSYVEILPDSEKYFTSP